MPRPNGAIGKDRKTIDALQAEAYAHRMTSTHPNSASNDRVLTGVVLMLGFCITAPLLDVAAKLAAGTIPVGQVTTARFVVQALLMAPLVAAMRLSFGVGRAQWLALTLRAVFLLISTFCFIAAIRVMPLADALAIAFIAPFIVLLIGKYALGEDVGPRRVAAAIVGFVGVLFVIQPSFAAFGVISLFPLGTAVSFALYILVTRGLSRRLHPVALQFHTGLIASLLCLPVLVLAQGSGAVMFDPVWPQGMAWLWLVGVGFFAAVSHMMMTYALSYAPSATLAPMQYLELPMATLLGFLVFQDFPNRLALLGIVIIIAAGLYMIHRERVTARSPTRA